MGPPFSEEVRRGIGETGRGGRQGERRKLQQRCKMNFKKKEKK